MRLSSSSCSRSGLSLLEVIISLAIFLFSLVAIGQLINMGSDRALDANFKQQATYLCQSKMAEYASGALGLGSEKEGTMEEDEAWRWSSEVNEDSVAPGLFRVQVRVWRAKPFGGEVSATMSQMVLSPRVRGSTLQPPPKVGDEEPGEDPAKKTEESGSTPSGSTPSGSGAQAGGNNKTGPGGGNTKTGGSGQPPGGGQSGGQGGTGTKSGGKK